MAKFGFIGFGSMAKMLIHGLVEYAEVNVADIIVTRKDKSKLTEITTMYPDIQISLALTEVADNSEYIFICVKPADLLSVLLEIKPSIRNKTHIISLAGTVNLKNILSIVDCKVTKLMPTIVSEIGEGISLICHSEKVTEKDEQLLNQYIRKLGALKIVADKDIGFAAELTSCAPGFIASIFDNMTKIAALHTSSFTIDEIKEMVTHTLYATSKLLLDKNLDYTDLIGRVATKGGITEEGILVFNEMLPAVFEAMFNKTLGKRAIVEKRISDDFSLL